LFCRNANTALATVIGSSNQQHATGETWEGAGCKEFDELFPESPYTGPGVYQTRVAMGGRLDCECLGTLRFLARSIHVVRLFRYVCGLAPLLFLDAIMTLPHWNYVCLAVSLIGLPVAAAPIYFADELSPIVVTATRSPVLAEDTLSDFVIISHEEIERSGHSSLMELLQAQRGVQIYSQGGSGTLSAVNLRGVKNSQSVLFVDGVRMDSSNEGGAILNLIPMGLIDHIEIIYGSRSTIYGADALGGVIQIFTKQGEAARKYGISTGYGSYGTSQETLHLLGTLDQENTTRYSLGVSRELASGYNTSASNRSALYALNPTTASGFNRTGLSGHVSWQWETHQEIGVKLFSSENNWAYPYTAFDANYNPFGVMSHGINKYSAFSLYSTNQISSNWKSDLQVTKVYNFHQDLTPPVATYPGSNDYLDMPETDVSWQNTFNFGNDVLQVILDRRDQGISKLFTQVVSACTPNSSGADSCHFESSRITNSIASAYSFVRGNHLTTLAIREDMITGYADKTNGSFEYGYQFAPGWRTNLDFNTGYRVPAYLDLYYPNNQGNPNLIPETSRNLELGVIYSGKPIHTRAFLFQNLVHNYIGLDANYIPQNKTSVRLKGVSYGLDTKFGNFKASVSIDYTNATDEGTGKQLARIAKFNSNWKLDYDNGHFNIGGGMTSSGATFDNSDNAPTTINTPYVLFNLYGSYKLDKQWTLFARLNNVLNTQYQTAFGYAMPGFNGFGGVRYSFE
jgi:vitamin B12 transporter